MLPNQDSSSPAEFIRRIGRWIWRAGRYLVVSLRAGDSLYSLQKSSMPAPLAVGLFIIGWIPRWFFHLLREVTLPDKKLEAPSIPTSISLGSGIAAIIAGIGAVAGFSRLYTEAKTLLELIPSIGVAAGIIAGIGTFVYIVTKFHEFHKALNPKEPAEDAQAPLLTRAYRWAQHFFNYKNFFGISPKDNGWFHHIGRISGTLLTALCAGLFAAGTITRLPVAFPLAVIGASAYFLGEFFEAKEFIASFYGHLQDSWKWFRGQLEETKTWDSKTWNHLSLLKRGFFYACTAGMTASVAISIAFLCPPAWAWPVGATLSAFFYPLFLSVIFKLRHRDPHPEEGATTLPAAPILPESADSPTPLLRFSRNPSPTHSLHEETQVLTTTATERRRASR